MYMWVCFVELINDVLVKLIRENIFDCFFMTFYVLYDKD